MFFVYTLKMFFFFFSETLLFLYYNGVKKNFLKYTYICIHIFSHNTIILQWYYNYYLNLFSTRRNVIIYLRQKRLELPRNMIRDTVQFCFHATINTFICSISINFREIQSRTFESYIDFYENYYVSRNLY